MTARSNGSGYTNAGRTSRCSKRFIDRLGEWHAAPALSHACKAARVSGRFGSTAVDFAFAGYLQSSSLSTIDQFDTLRHR